MWLKKCRRKNPSALPIILHFSASFSQFHLLFSLFLSSLPSPPYLTTPGKFMLLLKLFLIKIWCNYLPLKLLYSSLLTNCWCLLPQKWLHSLLNRDTTFISVCYIHTVKKKWYIMCNNIQDVLRLPNQQILSISGVLEGLRGFTACGRTRLLANTFYKESVNTAEVGYLRPALSRKLY